MRSTVSVILASGFLLAGCSSITPVAIIAGDTCHSCGKTITNVKLAAESIDPTGQALKFRTVGCMAKYLTSHPGPMRAVLVTDFQTGAMVRAQNAIFVRSDIDSGTHERDYFAFTNVRDAVEFGKAQEASPIDWFAIMQQTGATKAGN